MMASGGVVGEILAARRCGAPFVVVETGDAWGLCGLLARAIPDPVLSWDCVTGLRGLNEAGAREAARVVPEPEIPGVVPGRDLPEALDFCDRLVDRSVVIVLSSDRVLTAGNLPAVQAVVNRRDSWKARGCLLVFVVGLGAVLPGEVSGDALAFSESLPNAGARAGIIAGVVDDARLSKADLVVTADKVTGAADALSGLGAFAVEQSAALSLVSTGTLDGPYLWDRKRVSIAGVKGLSMDPQAGPTLADVGGLEYVRALAGKLAACREPFSLVVRIEEIEKAIGASKTESSGTSADQVGCVLDAMESRKWGGLVAVGPPGSGKSYFAETLARTFGRPSFRLDLGGLKASLVGESESNIRRALDTLFAMGGARVFFVATSNGLESIPPELIRRFWHGVYFFDLPSSTERAAIWRVHLAGYSLAARADEVKGVEARGVEWSSAEIRNVCRYAAMFDESLADSAGRVAPYCVSGARKLLALRQSAAGSWLSASAGGLYAMPGSGAGVVSGGRRLDLGGE